MKTISTENKVYEASKFDSWGEALDFIRESLDMGNEPYELGQEVSSVPPECIQISLYDKYTNDDNDEPIHRMKLFIYVDENNTLKDLIELQVHLLEWLNKLYTVYNDYSLDGYCILYKSKQGCPIELFKYSEPEEE